MTGRWFPRFSGYAVNREESIPGMGGIAIMEEIRKIRDDMPIILSSGYAATDVFKTFDDKDPTAFLQKPYDFGQLNKVIGTVLKKERRQRWVPLMDSKISDVAREATIEPGRWGSATVPSSERGLERSQRAQIVWDTIQTLKAKYRVPLVLHHYEGLSYKEIAEAMQISMSAVESRIHRAKKQLIKKLEPWMDKI